MTLPIFLEGHDPVARLGDWLEGGPLSARREISFGSGRGTIECRLTWWRSGERAQIVRVAGSVEEAAYRALDLFARAENSGPSHVAAPSSGG